MVDDGIIGDIPFVIELILLNFHSSFIIYENAPMESEANDIPALETKGK